MNGEGFTIIFNQRQNMTYLFQWQTNRKILKEYRKEKKKKKCVRTGQMNSSIFDKSFFKKSGNVHPCMIALLIYAIKAINTIYSFYYEVKKNALMIFQFANIGDSFKKYIFILFSINAESYLSENRLLINGWVSIILTWPT